jgi:two-component system, chemotaxis family, chemotaxis protein CheY
LGHAIITGNPVQLCGNPSTPEFPCAACIFIVDDSPVIRAAIRLQLESAGFDVCGDAHDGLDALDKLSRLKPDLIILDMSMPRMNGVDAARELKYICPDVPVILYSAYADAFRGRQVLLEGVSEVVAKGENLLDHVIRSLNRASGASR